MKKYSIFAFALCAILVLAAVIICVPEPAYAALPKISLQVKGENEENYTKLNFGTITKGNNWSFDGVDTLTITGPIDHVYAEGEGTLKINVTADATIEYIQTWDGANLEIRVLNESILTIDNTQGGNSGKALAVSGDLMISGGTVVLNTSKNSGQANSPLSVDGALVLENTSVETIGTSSCFIHGNVNVTDADLTVESDLYWNGVASAIFTVTADSNLQVGEKFFCDGGNTLYVNGGSVDVGTSMNRYGGSETVNVAVNGGHLRAGSIRTEVNITYDSKYVRKIDNNQYAGSDHCAENWVSNGDGTHYTGCPADCVVDGSNCISESCTYTYAANETAAVITVTCEGCASVGTVTLIVSDEIYDETEKPAAYQIDGCVPNAVSSNIKITYNGMTDAPTAQGHYTVCLNMGQDVQVSKGFYIRKQVTGVDLPADVTLSAYYEDWQNASEELPKTVTYTTQDEEQVSLDVEWSFNGTYDTYANAENTFAWVIRDPRQDLYAFGAHPQSGLITVTNAPKRVAMITASIPADLTYAGGASLAFAFDGKASASYANNTITVDGFDITFTDEDGMPVAAKDLTQAGKYIVTYSVADSDPYFSGSASFPFEIGKVVPDLGTVTAADLENATDARGVTITHNSAVEGTFALFDPAQKLVLGSNTVRYVFTPNDMRNYSTVQGDVEVTVLDTIAPTGEVKLGLTAWQQFLNTVTFDLLFGNAQTLQITAHDNFAVDKIEYYESASALSFAQVQALDAWNVCNGNVRITAEDAKRCVYYVRITDTSGNVAYLSSDGMTFDTAAPVIAGVENGASYYTDQTVTVTDAHDFTVKVNGESAVGTITLKGNCDAVYTITAVDALGNSSAVTVTMKPVAALIDRIDNAVAEDLTKDDLPAVEALLEEAEALLAEGKLDVEDANLLAEAKTALETALNDIPKTGQKAGALVFALLAAVSMLGIILVCSKRRKFFAA